MKQTLINVAGAVALSVLASQALAAPGAPNFSEAIYADGTAFGTKGTTALPAPNEYNRQSFDALYVVTNDNNPETQLPISEAGPGNPDYNGGRWFTHTVEWTEAGFLAHGIVPILKSYEDIMHHKNLGHLVITPGSFPGGPMVYFQCPLLPVK